MNKRKLLPPAGALYSSRPKRTVQYIPEPPEKKTKYFGMAMSVEDMAEELAIGRNVAYQLVQQPDFPSFMIGRRVLVSRKGLQEWIDEQCKKGPEAATIAEASEP